MSIVSFSVGDMTFDFWDEFQIGVGNILGLIAGGIVIGSSLIGELIR